MTVWHAGWTRCLLHHGWRNPLQFFFQFGLLVKNQDVETKPLAKPCALLQPVLPRSILIRTQRLGEVEHFQSLDLFIKGPASIILVPTLPSKANAVIFHSRDLFFKNHHPARVFCFHK